MSRKLDAAVWRALGYEVYESKEEWLKAGMPYIQYWSSVVEYPAYWYPAHESNLVVPELSSNPVAMLELDKEMQVRGFACLVKRYVPAEMLFSDPLVNARYYKAGDKMDGQGSWGDTEPFARALAAYKALTGKEWVEP